VIYETLKAVSSIRVVKHWLKIAQRGRRETLKTIYIGLRSSVGNVVE